MMGPEIAVLSNNRQQAKLSWKRKEAIRMADALKEDIESYGIVLPRTYQDYKANRERILEKLGYDITDEFVEAWNAHHEEIVKLQYVLRSTNKAVYAVFDSKSVVKSQLVSAWYTKHRMDPVWNWRKSQLIRKAYRSWLETARDADGNLVRSTYTPCHLVLTVPHDVDGHRGEKFYLRALLSMFHEMRRAGFFKKHVYGGEYGAEIKRSRSNGLHIHIHSLLFLRDSCTINIMREWVRQRWAKLCGSEGRVYIHLEQLYTWQRKGTCFIYENRKAKDGHGYYDAYRITFEEDDSATAEPVKVKKKMYVGKDSPLEEYLSGVVECIKYHFKGDAYYSEDGSIDCALIRDILNNSRRLRLYSRYGALYDEKELNFDYKDGDDDTDVDGDALKAFANLVNPHTMQPAEADDFILTVASPEKLRYSGKDDVTPYALLSYDTDIFQDVGNISVAQLIKFMVRGRIDTLINPVADKKAAVFDLGKRLNGA